jgi:hypothetical protein
MAATGTHPTWRIVPFESHMDPARRCGALAAEDAQGRTAAVARFDGPATGDTRVELSLQLGPVRPPAEIVGELVRSAAALATEAGANRFEVDYDPVCGFARDVLAASELAWQVRESGDRALAEIALADTRGTAAPPVAGSASVVGTTRRA